MDESKAAVTEPSDPKKTVPDEPRLHQDTKLFGEVTKNLKIGCTLGKFRLYRVLDESGVVFLTGPVKVSGKEEPNWMGQLSELPIGAILNPLREFVKKPEEPPGFDIRQADYAGIVLKRFLAKHQALADSTLIAVERTLQRGVSWHRGSMDPELVPGICAFLRSKGFYVISTRSLGSDDDNEFLVDFPKSQSSPEKRAPEKHATNVLSRMLVGV